MPRLELTPRAPYDFRRAALFFSSRSSLPVGHGITGQNGSPELTLVTTLNNAPVEITIARRSNLQGPLRVQWRQLQWRSAHTVTAEVKNSEVERFVRRTFSLDLDLRDFYRALAPHGKLAPMATSLRGLKPTLTDTVLDAAIWAIVGQQVTLSFARILRARIFSAYGRAVDWRGARIHLTPQPERLARASLKKLRSLQLSENKARYLKELAGLIAKGSLNLEQLREMEHDSALERLLALKGIGPWTANYILMRGAGRLDALPVGDAGLNRALVKVFNLSERPTSEKATALAEPFRPYRSLFTLYLWQAHA
ncbi:MAG TPA: DNA-3-methyladenine glycosylase [candidate division Zixibacteria bacterium]|nr:DNA-3-methyladenine glycosylase [candidate division Zixibacteria bacterium]